jgi:hypothetical protein
MPRVITKIWGASPDQPSDIRDFHISFVPAYCCARAGYLLLAEL